MEKILRVYLPSTQAAKWFNAFLKDKNDIDVWLSPRLIKDNLISEGVFNSTLVGNKYYAELKVNYLNDWKSIQKIMDLRGIKFKVLLDDVEKYLASIQIKKIKREEGETQQKSRYLNLKNKVVGKYASYNDIVQWMVQFYIFYMESIFSLLLIKIDYCNISRVNSASIVKTSDFLAETKNET